MKVAIKEKSEGHVVVEFAADSPFEAMLMSTVPPDSITNTSVEGKSATRYVGSGKPGANKDGIAHVAIVTFGAFFVDAHDMVQR